MVNKYTFRVLSANSIAALFGVYSIICVHTTVRADEYLIGKTLSMKFDVLARIPDAGL